MTTKEKADAAVDYHQRMVELANEAVARADRRVAKVQAHLDQAYEARSVAVEWVSTAETELAQAVETAAGIEDEAAQATAHDAGVITESNN